MKKTIILLVIICYANVFGEEKSAKLYRPAFVDYTVGIKWDNVSQLGASFGYIWLSDIKRYELANTTKGLLTEIEFAMKTGKLNIGYIRKTILLAGSIGWSVKASYLHRWQERNDRDDINYLGFMVEGWVFFLGGSTGLYTATESSERLFLVGISIRL